MSIIERLTYILRSQGCWASNQNLCINPEERLLTLLKIEEEQYGSKATIQAIFKEASVHQRYMEYTPLLQNFNQGNFSQNQSPSDLICHQNQTQNLTRSSGQNMQLKKKKILPSARIDISKGGSLTSARFGSSCQHEIRVNNFMATRALYLD